MSARSGRPTQTDLDPGGLGSGGVCWGLLGSDGAPTLPRTLHWLQSWLNRLSPSFSSCMGFRVAPKLLQKLCSLSTQPLQFWFSWLFLWLSLWFSFLLLLSFVLSLLLSILLSSLLSASSLSLSAHLHSNPAMKPTCIFGIWSVTRSLHFTQFKKVNGDKKPDEFCDLTTHRPRVKTL